MRGDDRQPDSMFSYVSPEQRVPSDHPLRAIRALKSERDGEIEVAGPNLARSLTELGLIDEYRIYLHPVVLGRGAPLPPEDTRAYQQQRRQGSQHDPVHAAEVPLLIPASIT